MALKDATLTFHRNLPDVTFTQLICPRTNYPSLELLLDCVINCTEIRIAPCVIIVQVANRIAPDDL